MDVDKRPKSGLDLAVMMLLEFQGQLKIARAIIEKMAELPLGYSHEAGNYCVLCYADDSDRPSDDKPVEHTTECPVTKARQWLAENPA